MAKRGRPSLGAAARSVVVPVRLTNDERERLDRASGDLSVAEWVRDRIERATVARIAIRPDEGDWHWVAYDRRGRAAGTGGLAAGPDVERRVLKDARESGLDVEDAVIEYEDDP